MTSPVQFPVSKRSISDLSPQQHYSMRIQQFSLLAETQEKFESSTFVIWGYNWRLRLYPKGNSKSFESAKEHHISLYLAIEKRDSFPKLWEVFVQIKFYAFDHIHNEYAIFGDESVKRYHEKKTEYGIQIPINDCNGYLVDDTCVLGAEVFVLTPSTIHESIYSVTPGNGPIALKLPIYPTMKCKPNFIAESTPWNGSMAWEFPFNPKMECKPIFTEEFISGNYKWTVRGDPEDCGKNKMSLSLCLLLIKGYDLGSRDRVVANYELRVTDKNYKDMKVAISKSFTTNERLYTEKPTADACYVCESSSNTYDLPVEVEILSMSVSKKVS